MNGLDAEFHSMQQRTANKLHLTNIPGTGRLLKSLRLCTRRKAFRTAKMLCFNLILEHFTKTVDPFRSSFRPVSLSSAVHECVHCLMCASATYLDEKACLTKCQVFKINAVEKISCMQ